MWGETEGARIHFYLVSTAVGSLILVEIPAGWQIFVGQPAENRHYAAPWVTTAGRRIPQPAGVGGDLPEGSPSSRAVNSAPLAAGGSGHAGGDPSAVGGIVLELLVIFTVESCREIQLGQGRAAPPAPSWDTAGGLSRNASWGWNIERPRGYRFRAA